MCVIEERRREEGEKLVLFKRQTSQRGHLS